MRGMVRLASTLLNDRDQEQTEHLPFVAAAHDTLLTAIETLPAPSCIALYGAWGAGKSTLLRHAYRSYGATHGGRALWFDPWEYERRADVVSPLLHALVSHARTNQSRGDLAWQIARNIARVLASLALRTGGKQLLDIELEPDKLRQQFDEWSRYHDEIATLKSDFARLIRLVLDDESDKAPFVFFLDDLDRCLPDSVLAVLEGVKLLLCGDPSCRASFVFALDRQVVGDSIAQRYSVASSYSGETYLEKIFDLSLEVPPLANGTAAGMLQSQWSAADIVEIGRRLEPIGGSAALAQVLENPAFANPRVIKRVVNRLILLFRDAGVAAWSSTLSHSDQTRFLCWVAGAERFRSFRYKFMSATGDELAQLAAAIKGGGAFQVSPELNRAVNLPDFRGYFTLLGLTHLNASGFDDERNPSSSGSLRRFDDVLRSAGL